MNETPPPLFTEALADELADRLNRLSTAFENAYYAQIHRYLETMSGNRDINND